MYPAFFIPTDKEIFNIENTQIEIPKCVIQFERWNGEKVKETFGGKPIVCLQGKAMFAELAIMKTFILEGWEARWIETYGKSKAQPIHLSDWKDDKYKNQIANPILNKDIIEVLSGIAKYNNDSNSGCWDVIGWKNDKIIFAESKRTKKDKIRSTQINWLSAGLKFGLRANNFLVVQWEMK